MKKKLIRITTVPISLLKLLEGQLNFMNSYFEVTAISSKSIELDKLKKKEGVAIYSVEMSRKITPLKDAISILKLYFYFKKQKPYIVHTHTPKAGFVGMIASILARVPNRLHTVAGLPLLETKGIKRKILQLVEQLTCTCATRVYPNSFGLKNIIIENNLCSQSKLKVIANGSSNGIDLDYFSPKQISNNKILELKVNLGIKETDFVYIFVGRMVKDKGINELIIAFESLSKKHPNVKLLLVGSMEVELDPLFTSTIQKIKNHPSIISVGWKDDVRIYFSISNVLVFPSYREGFPNVVLQAGAMSIPSIVTNINGCNEIIENNINGILIPVKNSFALEIAMERLLMDQNLYLIQKNNTRLKIEENFNQKVIWNSLLKEYQNL